MSSPQIDAIGVDEIQYSKGHKYLTLVYQIDLYVTRLLWIGKERTIESFQGFFTTIGEEITSKIVFICSDMWEPYLKVIREKCSDALHILERFHIRENEQGSRRSPRGRIAAWRAKAGYRY
jgi:transposase